MPVFFLAHGSPVNALEENRFTQDWQQITRHTPPPKTLIFISAHWETPTIKITAKPILQTLHDFTGFPSALYQLNHSYNNDIAMAKAMNEKLNVAGFDSSLDYKRDLDHGCWTLLQHIFKNQLFRVVQISLSTTYAIKTHVAIADLLKTFRSNQVAFIASGNIIHNIPYWMQLKPNTDTSWAKLLDQTINQAVIDENMEKLINYQHLPFSQLGIPTLEHYLPFIYALSLKSKGEMIRTSHFAEDDFGAHCSRSFKFG